MNNKDSQELLENYSQTPVAVKESSKFKEFFESTTKEEKSRKIFMKNLEDTIRSLKLNRSARNKEQVKIIAAAATSVRYIQLT